MRAFPARQSLTLLVASALVAGCASEPAPARAPEAPQQVAAAAPPAAASAPRRVCNRERITGTTMAQTVCRDVDEHGAIADQVEALNRTMTNGNAAQMSRTGGH